MSLYLIETENKGRGVCSDVDLFVGDEIEICPVLVFSPKDCKHIDKTFLYNYYFMWNDDGKSGAIVLGYGSLYNHSYNPNAQYETYYEEKIFRVIARKHIPANTEITFNYNFYPESQDKLWFDIKE